MDRFLDPSPARRPEELRRRLSKGRALIIEDDAVIALELEALLCDLGYERAVFADTVEDALAQARLNPPDLISADYRIIGGTGLQAVQAIEAELGTRPVIYVTANADAVRRESTAPIVEKPISHRALRRALEDALTRFER